MFVGMQNVTAVLGDESGDGGDDTFAVRTREKENCRLPGHRLALMSFMISLAAFAPEAPVKPVPGWVPDPHR